MIPICVTLGLARVCHVCIDLRLQMLINKKNLSKRGFPVGRALLQDQLFRLLTKAVICKPGAGQ